MNTSSVIGNMGDIKSSYISFKIKEIDDTYSVYRNNISNIILLCVLEIIWRN